MIATSGFLAALEWTKFLFCRGSVRTPLGEDIEWFIRHRSWFKGPTSKGGGRGERRKREVKGRERKRTGRTVPPYTD